MRSLALSMTSRMFTESERSKIDKYATKLGVLDGMISVLFESHDVPSFSSGPAKIISSSSLHTGWYAGDPAILGWFREWTRSAKSMQLHRIEDLPDVQ